MDRDPETESGPLRDVAEAIADGKAVDWGTQTPTSRDETLRIDRLRLVQRVANAYHDVHHNPAPEYEAPPPEATTATPPIEEQTPLFMWGPLRVLEAIGKGAFAEVFRAYDPALRLEVALKLQRCDVPLSGAARARFIDEARALARVRHDHVVTVHGVDIHDNRIGIWTDLVRGETLAAHVDKHGPFSTDEVVCIGMNLCSALAALHAVDLVHRDLKPTNVMRDRGGHILLMDFGSACAATPSTPSDRHSVTGTPLTTAPEVLLHGAAPHPSQDVYGLGVLLYWILSGRYPVEASSLEELVHKHERGAMRPLLDARPDVTPAVVPVIERALAPRPGDRFASAGEMQRALAAGLGLQRNDRNGARRNRRSWAVLVGLVAVMGVSLAAFVAPRFRAAPRVEAALYREDAQSEDRLADGSRVRPHEGLFLEILFDRPMFVWVVNEDEHGNAFMLYPIGATPNEPLAQGKTHRLPGLLNGQHINWITSAERGRETILVVASANRLPELERQIAGLARPADAAASTNDAQVHRGIGQVAPRTPGTNGRGVIARIQREYGERQGPGGVWLWKVQLVNEGS